MAMSKGTSHYNHQSWEDSEFPIICGTCLGDNPYVRMMKDRHGSECKICQRPFTTFRWCPGHKMRYKKTEVCQTCARAKNVCQTCLLDLVYGLPVQVRDSVLSIQQDMPKDETNREFFNQNLDRDIKETDAKEAWGPHKAAPPSDVLTKLARNSPYYKRNRAHVCSFWVKGECRRGEECPYRHEKPTDPDDPLSDQNIRDRYYGNKDPVAEKLLKRVSEMPKPQAPEDKTITTVYVGNVGERIEEKDLRDYFYQFGEIRNISVVNKQNCAFVTYSTRAATEMAIENSYQKLVIHGQRLVIRWGRSFAKRGPNGEKEDEKPENLPGVPGLPIGSPDYFNLSASTSSGSNATSTSTSSSATASSSGGPSSSGARIGIYYPSQDPERFMGTYKKSNQH